DKRTLLGLGRLPSSSHRHPTRGPTRSPPSAPGAPLPPLSKEVPMPGWLLTPLKKLFGDDFGLGPSSVNIILWILRGCFGAINIDAHPVGTSPAVVTVPYPAGQKPVQMQVIRLIVTVICCYICISLLLQTKDEFRFIIPYVEFSKQIKGGKPLVLDTSVIIDGRIADICDTRIIDAKMIVPRFVLQELQHIADSSDKLKRNRGRRGMDMLKKMQDNPKVELQVHEANLAELRDVQKVDERLVIFAKALAARVVTNDYNLNKIAQLQGVDVINLNEVANALKSVALPGEILNVRLVKAGDQIGQGVGYLD